MKILLAYDGSRCAEAALDDLQRAGLPKTGEATVVSVAEVWLPPPDNGAINGTTTNDPYIEKIVHRRREKGERALAEAGIYARHAETRLRKLLPDWKLAIRSTYGSPAWEILTAADEIEPDLIIVGSHGQSALSRFVLGSISQKVLTEAHCSVRVARGRIEIDPSPVRIIIGFDASAGSHKAVRAVAERNWPADTEVRLISVTDPLHPTTLGRFVPPVSEAIEEVNETERKWLEGEAKNALNQLREKGLSAELHIIGGNPKSEIAEEAEKWNADSIFVGANAFGSRVERFLIGSTSSAIASRAHCSVEVVRMPDNP